MGRALFVVFKKENGILEGGGLANQRNLQMGRQLLGEENVDVVYIHDEAKGRTWWNLLLSCLCFPFGYYNGILPSRVRHIVRKAQDYDYVFLSTSLLGIVAKRLKESNYRGTVLAHFHNVESIYYDSLLSKRLPLREIVIRCAAKNDEYCCRYADKVLTLNKRDSDTLHKMYGREADILVPIALADKCTTGEPDRQTLTGSRPLCLFLGSYFTANNEGILWFVRNVLPHVDVELKIVGKNMARLQREHECLKDIDVVSDAPDLSPYFRQADFMILPIFSGSGMKVKTCESLMYGKNILGTDEAFEGYQLDAEMVGARCNTAEEYIRAIKCYAEKPRPRFNVYSRSVYEELYSEDSSLRSFRKVFGLDANVPDDYAM